MRPSKKKGAASIARGAGSRGAGAPSAGAGVRRKTAAAELARLATVIGLAAVIVLAIGVRLRVASAPFERDEGEYAYAGQLILQGVPPYRLAYNMKFPGTYYAYALSMAVFGQNVRGVRFGLILANVAAILLLYAIGRRLAGRLAGVAAAVSYGLFSLDIHVLGLAAHATHFVLPPILAGLYWSAWPAPKHRALSTLASGVLIGIGVIVKQHAIAFLPLAALLIALRPRAAEKPEAAALGSVAPESATKSILFDLVLLGLGALLPFAGMCAYLWQAGVFPSFWFWAIQYARAYVSEVPLDTAWQRLLGALRQVTAASLMLWGIAGAGLVALWWARWRAFERLFVTGLVVAGFIALCPGFYFREHYFILLFPALAILVGVAFESGARLAERAMSATTARTLAAVLLVGLGVTLVVRQSDAFFTMSPRDISRFCYGNNPFIESIPIAEYIKSHTTPQDRIAVLGSEPQIYFYSDRRSATGYIYTYALMEKQKYASRMQGEMIREIEAAHPKYLVFAKTQFSWLYGPDSDEHILEWTNRYVASCYDLVGIAETVSFEETHYAWDAAAASYNPQSDNAVFVFRRKSDAACVAP